MLQISEGGGASGGRRGSRPFLSPGSEEPGPRTGRRDSLSPTKLDEIHEMTGRHGTGRRDSLSPDSANEESEAGRDEMFRTDST